MSLDVSLFGAEVEEPCSQCQHPRKVKPCVYSANVTHNLNRMAEEAGIYKELWRPDEIGIKKAGELIEPLRKGLALLRGDPQRFIRLNPPNGWGSYAGFVPWVEKYLAACETNPEAEVSVWR